MGWVNIGHKSPTTQVQKLDQTKTDESLKGVPHRISIKNWKHTVEGMSSAGWLKFWQHTIMQQKALISQHQLSYIART